MNFFGDKRFWYALVAVIVVVIVVAVVILAAQPNYGIAMAPPTDKSAAGYAGISARQRHQSSNASYSPFRAAVGPRSPSFHPRPASAVPEKRRETAGSIPDEI